MYAKLAACSDPGCMWSPVRRSLVQLSLLQRRGGSQQRQDQAQRRRGELSQVTSSPG